MLTLHGVGVSRGVAVGRLSFLRSAPAEAPAQIVADPEKELARFETARATAVAQLDQLAEDTRGKLGEEEAQLFEIHQMMLEDLDYLDAIQARIQGGPYAAEYAVQETGRQFAQMFSDMDDPYMKERSADVLDVSRRVIRVLRGENDAQLGGGEPCVIAASDLAPSETARLDRERVLAFITAKGAANSHTAIFARTMGIPAVVNLRDALTDDLDGRQVCVDGSTGEVFVDPDEQTAQDFARRREAEEAHRVYVEQFRGKQAHTPEGKPILVCANVGSPDDVKAAVAADADGVGLFRSEFLYLGRDDFPSEEEQFRAYQKAVQLLEGRTLVVRTLDIGADKQADYFELPKEDNPAMGLRAIRICLTRPEIFRTQLRALYRASAFGKLAIMFPMIISVDEVRRIKDICADVRNELKAEGVAYDETVELGIMIETPAAAVMADALAPEVNFFSIGTNDLTQYTLAADRQNTAITPFIDRHHPALLRLIAHTVKSAHEGGAWVGICGELAADPELTARFVELGVDELSMSPGAILDIKAKILDP